ncbi:MAG: hypothetical protein JKY66_05185 [Spongiibacteraceae bacterium]|nr:hypothetical protein [Spongiibacteraceae bacterium]
MNRSLLIILVLFSTVSCTSVISSSLQESGLEVIQHCISETEKYTNQAFSPQVDRAYVHVLKDGYWVIFMHGRLGTFGKIGANSKTIWSCAVLDNSDSLNIVFLGAPLTNDLVNKPSEIPNENEENITELLFNRVGDRFEYCCSQKFDEKNIDKHNPDFPWDKNKVS